MPQGAVSNGKHIDAFIPPHLRDMFYRHPTRPYAWNNGLDPYGFSTDGLVFYAPLWALKDSSFKSVDAYGHTGTVTGALWQPDGRLFDGVDDVINFGADAGIANIFDGGGTAIAWIKPSSDGEGDSARIITKRADGWNLILNAEAGGFIKLRMLIDFDTTTGDWITGSAVVPINTWSMVALTFNSDSDSNNPIIYWNTTAYTVGNGLTESVSPVGTRDTDAGTTMYVGNTGATGSTFDGSIGEIWLYKGNLFSAAEIAHHRSVTAWRYQ